MSRAVASLLSAVLVIASPLVARAFCGFYVGGADATLYNNATVVVLMREGTRTVLSMQNNYQGPPAGFAMVVPVPVVLQKENVKTLPREVFAHVDKLAAPRLVEYWEQDPCPKPVPDGGGGGIRRPMRAAGPMPAPPMAKAKDLGVTIEAQFTVGEYEIVILSAKDSMGLDTWIRREGYKIPAGAEPFLRPYVQQGMKFFVAKVDVTKVRFENGQAMLSPLRFHYDSDTFSLPVRLGLVNSSGTQDLLVHVLARGQRYEVANFDNVSIPTNLDVGEGAQTRFGEFYAALFDETLRRNKGAVVTEYSWDASTCDPCPTPGLSPAEMMTLGADVLPSSAPPPPPPPVPPPVPPAAGDPSQPGKPIAIRPMPPRPRFGGGFVITRLHARYTKDSLGDDLVFREAPPIVGGREFVRDGSKLEQGAVQSQINNFQARYAIRHPWKGPIACKNPVRGVWGGPPAGVAGDTRPRPALDLAFVPRGAIQLASVLAKDGVEPALATAILLSKGTPLPRPPPVAEPPPEPQLQPKPAGRLSGGVPAGEGGCAGCRASSDAPATGAAAALAAAVIAVARVVSRRRLRKGTDRSSRGPRCSSDPGGTRRSSR